jgi:hypothetical protein
MSDKSLVSIFSQAPAATQNTFASENFNTVLYTGNGSTQRIGGYINRGAVFNGSSSKVQTPVIPLTGTSFSISAWVKKDNDTSAMNVFAQGNSSDNNPIISITFGGTNGLELINRNNSAVGLNTTITAATHGITAGSFHHLVVVFTTTSYTLYVDGSSVSTGSFTANTGTFNTQNIGVRQRVAYDSYFNGTIDQVRIFNKALSSSEVTTLYGETHASTTISTTDIFDDDSGVALYQLDGNANDTGGVSGKFGSGAIFNGSSSQIDLNYASLGMGVNDFSYSFWFKANNTTAEQVFFQVLSEHVNYGIKINDPSGHLSSKPTNSSGGTEYISAAVTIDTDWHHVAYIKSSTTGVGHALYYDGTKIAEDTSFTGNVQASTDNKTTLGSATNDIAWFDGFLDDVRFYNDVLTSAEVGYIYNNTTASIPTDNLAAHYKFNGDARDEQQLYDATTVNNITYAYDGTASNVTYQEATKFTPDLVWVKKRSNAEHHNLYDVIRGTTKGIFTSSTSSEQTGSNFLTSFDSNGFTVGNSSYVNTSGHTYAAWCFNAGTAAAASNTDGSITSTVKANTEAGFSIVKYTSNGSYTSSDTIGHGLNQKCELVIWKPYESTSSDWYVQYEVVDGSVDYLLLNASDAERHSASTYLFQNDVLVNFAGANGQDTIAYCFHSVDGYQKIGKYTSDGSDGDVFVDTGFQPAFLMIKNVGSAHDWMIYDNKRDTANLRDSKLSPNTNGAEYSATSIGIDFTSDGFVIRGTDDAINDTTDTFIYLAIAADPDETTPTVENSFDVVTYTGNGSTQSIATDFKPDLVWIKDRDNTNHHTLFDSIRGDDSVLYSDLTNAVGSGEGFASFDSNGFTLDTGYTRQNANSVDYVAWCWKAGDHDDSLPEINTEGTIDSVVSVNDAAGFSIVKFTSPSTNTTGFTVGHGLSSAPDLIITKPTDAAVGWHVYSSAFSTPSQSYLQLQSTAAILTGNTNIWNNTAATSTVFSMKTGYAVGTSSETIAYCFTSITGYQKVGTFNNVGSAGTVNLGFKPRFVMIKKVDGTDNWRIYDSQRDSDGINNKELYANLSNAEYTSTSFATFTSTGLDFTGGNSFFQSGEFLYLAIK